VEKYISPSSVMIFNLFTNIYQESSSLNVVEVPEIWSINTKY